LSVDKFSRGLYLYSSDDNDVDSVMEVVMMMRWWVMKKLMVLVKTNEVVQWLRF